MGSRAAGRIGGIRGACSCGVMAKHCLAFRHVPFEDVGIFGSVLADAGYELDYFDAGTDRFDPGAAMATDLLVILGGPVAVYETDKYPILIEEIEAIRRRLVAGRPTLGICLGLQLITSALDGNVGPGPAKEIGWASITLTEEGRASVLAPLEGHPVLHWHGDLAVLPAGAKRLAETDVCHNQAFAIGATVLALQFHVELDPRRIEQWLIGHSIELAEAGVDLAVVRSDTARHGDATAAIGARILRRWLENLPDGDRTGV